MNLKSKSTTFIKATMILTMSLFFSIQLVSCQYKDSNAVFSVTAYFIHVEEGRNATRHKLDYVEYNVDSNAVYEEIYSEVQPSNEPYEKCQWVYKGKKEVSSTNEWVRSRGYAGYDTVRFTKEYSGDNIIREFGGGKPIKAYEYDANNKLSKELTFYEGSVDVYTNYEYDNSGLKIRTKSFRLDTLLQVDTFIYDSHRRLIEHFTFNAHGEKSFHELYTRDNTGNIVEKKWRDRFDVVTLGDYEKGINPEFWYTIKYYYDKYGHNVKQEYFEKSDKASIVYEYEWK